VVLRPFNRFLRRSRKIVVNIGRQFLWKQGVGCGNPHISSTPLWTVFSGLKGPACRRKETSAGRCKGAMF